MKKLMIRNLLFLLISFCLMNVALAETEQKFTLEYSTTYFLFDRDDFPINEYQTLDVSYLTRYSNEKNFLFHMNSRLRMDFLDSSRNRYLPHEAYLAFFNENLDFKIGLIQMSWGNSVLFNSTDLVNRRDLQANYLLREKLADPIASLTWSSNNFQAIDEISFKVFVMPYFIETPLPNNDMRFALQGSQNNVPYSLYPEQEHPNDYFDQMAFGSQFSIASEKIDFEIVSYHGPDRVPGYYLKIDDNGGLRLAPFYYTIDMVGSHLQLHLNRLHLKSTASYKMTFRSETQPHEVQPVADDAVPGNIFFYMVGADYDLAPARSPFNLRMSIEYFGDLQNAAYAFFNPNAFQNDILTSFAFQHSGKTQAQIQLGVVKDLENSEWVFLFDNSALVHKSIRVGTQVYYSKIADGSALDFFANNSFAKAYVTYTWGASSQ